MTISNEALRWAYEHYLDIEASNDLDLGSLETSVSNKFLRRPEFDFISDEVRETMAQGISGVIISLAQQYDKDYESFFGG